MAENKKGYINLISTEPGYSVANGFYIKIRFTFWYNPAYYLRTDLGSLRFFYRSPSQAQGDASYVDITEENADVFMPPSMVSGDAAYADRQIVQTTPNKAEWTVEYTLKNLSPSTEYKVRIWLRLFNKKGELKSKKIYSPIEAPLPVTTQDYVTTQPLFSVISYNIVTNNDETTIESLVPVDFTDCIKLGSYDVNFEDVNEDWDDADYRTHRIRVRQKVTGKFEMIFDSMYRYKLFMALLEKSRLLNDKGNAYVQLQVQVNNAYEDISQAIPLEDVKCLSYLGYFFIKIDNNAWIQPIFGHYDKYSALSVTITEA